MTLYQVFIPSLFNQQTKSQSEDYRPWVTNFVNDNINKLSSVFLSKQMGLINLVTILILTKRL